MCNRPFLVSRHVFFWVIELFSIGLLYLSRNLNIEFRKSKRDNCFFFLFDNQWWVKEDSFKIFQPITWFYKYIFKFLHPRKSQTCQWSSGTWVWACGTFRPPSPWVCPRIPTRCLLQSAWWRPPRSSYVPSHPSLSEPTSTDTAWCTLGSGGWTETIIFIWCKISIKKVHIFITGLLCNN